MSHAPANDVFSRIGLWLTEPRRYALGLAAIVVAAFVAYLPALNGEMLWDDDAHITRPELRSAEGLYRIWSEKHATQQYYPLLNTAFWVQHRLWGDHMLGYHVVNLLLHITAACLVFTVVRKLQIPGALLAAAVFALHPVQVESVAWISEQKNTLSAVFYLSAMLAYLSFDAERRGKWYILALGLFFLALCSKTVVATLPAALLVIFWWSRSRDPEVLEGRRGTLSWRRDVLPLIPFFAFGAIAAWFTVSVERDLIGSDAALYNLTAAERILLAGRAIWFYLATLFWPFNLTFIYPPWDLDARQLWQWLFPAGVLAVLAVCWLVRKQTRAPLAAALFFIGTLAPALGVVSIYPFRYTFVADHFQYLACLGVIVPVCGAVAAWLARSNAEVRYVGRLACLLVVGALAMLTWLQSRMYGNPIMLYETTIKKNPTCWMAYNNLGVILLGREALPDATRHLEQAVSLNAASREARNNLGVAYRKAGRNQEGIEQLRQVVAMDPRLGISHYNLGTALLSAGETSEANQELQEAVRLDAKLAAPVHGALGMHSFNAGQHDAAIAHFQQALALQANFPKVHYNLGLALLKTGRTSEALLYLEQAIQKSPDDAECRNDLAAALIRLGRAPEAIQHLEEAVRLKPELLTARSNLGKLLLQTGKPQEAIPHLEQSVKFAPDTIEGWSNLASANAQAHRPQEALAAGQKALEIALARGDTAMAAQLEAWLSGYRAAAQSGGAVQSSGAANRSRPTSPTNSPPAPRPQ